MNKLKIQKHLLILIMLAGVVCLFPKDAKAKTPTNKDACMNNGWTTFNYPAFKNQGDCLRYISKTNLSITSYLLDGVANDATLDVSTNSSVSISITASRPVSWYRVWICEKGDALCDDSRFIQYWHEIAPPYSTDFNVKWDGKNNQGFIMPNGEYMIRVSIADEFGNEILSNLEPYTITVTRLTSSVTITGISPVTGATAGGDRVHIAGTGFMCPNEIVSFGGKKAPNWSDSQYVSIDATTPPGTAGPVDVTVTNDCGTATVTGGFTYQ